VLCVGGVRTHLVEVLLSSSLDLCPLHVKVRADLDQSPFRDLNALFLGDEGLLPSEELLLQLLHCRSCRRHG
jgi:hypothetical protein